MPFAALPLVVAFGIPGTLLFNVLVVGALAVVLQRLARPVATPWAAGAASLLLIFGTFLRRYDYNFSPICSRRWSSPRPGWHCNAGGIVKEGFCSAWPPPRS